MPEIVEIESWNGAAEPHALEALEDGSILFSPNLSFQLSEHERARFMTPEVVKQPRKHAGRARIIYEPGAKKTRRTTLEGAEREEMETMMARFTAWAKGLVEGLLPSYVPALELGPATFRVCPRTGVQGLHVDSFFFLPTEGRRILRLFCNVNPVGLARQWQLGREPFEPFAQRYLPRVGAAVPGSGWLLQRLGVTERRRTAYDHTMRWLRALAKRDPQYRRSGDMVDFPSGSTWLVYTDSVLHGAAAGHYAFEQTFLLPVEAMADPAKSPLRILERLRGRSLA